MPDSLSFDTQNDIEGYTNDSRVTAVADFYKANSSKPFTLNMYGVVATTAAADLSFANQRVQKIASSLQAQGVPSSRIVIEAPQNITTYNGGVWAGQTSDPTAQRLARSVNIAIVPPASCSPGSSSSSSTGR